MSFMHLETRSCPVFSIVSDSAFSMGKSIRARAVHQSSLYFIKTKVDFQKSLTSSMCSQGSKQELKRSKSSPLRATLWAKFCLLLLLFVVSRSALLLHWPWQNSLLLRALALFCSRSLLHHFFLTLRCNCNYCVTKHKSTPGAKTHGPEYPENRVLTKFTDLTGIRALTVFIVTLCGQINSNVSCL